MRLPLEGIRVLDLSRLMAGPYCAMMLADVGAEVIKIEPPRGEDSRFLPPFIKGESGYYMSANRNKKGITLDLTKERGKEVFWRLVEKADVVLENFRPGITQQLGIHYEAVARVNPRVIYCSISGFGSHGPYRHRPGVDLIFQAMGGLMGITGEPQGPPVKVGTNIADVTAGMLAAYGIAVALFHRQLTGSGQKVELSLLDGTIATQTPMAAWYFATGESPGKMGSATPFTVPCQYFKTSDGFVNVAVVNDKFWRKLCNVIGRQDLAEDPRFRSNPDRVQHRRELVPLLEAIFAQRSTADWLASLEREGIPCAPIRDYHEVFSDPQVRENGMVVEMDHPIAGKVRAVGNPVKFGCMSKAPAVPPPYLGQHTSEVLASLGYSAEAIRELKAEGVI